MGSRIGNSMGKLLLSLVALYIAVTYYSVRRSSEPAEPCDGSKQCFRPLVTSQDRLSLELWILEEIPPDDELEQKRQRRTKYQWARAEGCQNDLIFDVADAKTVFDATNANCTLQLPDFSRRRGHKDSQPLKAKFVIRFDDDNSTIVANAPFDLTRIVERNEGGGGPRGPLPVRWTGQRGTALNRGPRNRFP